MENKIVIPPGKRRKNISNLASEPAEMQRGSGPAEIHLEKEWDVSNVQVIQRLEKKGTEIRSGYFGKNKNIKPRRARAGGDRAAGNSKSRRWLLH